MCAGVQIRGDNPPFIVGDVATLSCDSDSDAMMIEWIDGNNTRVNMTTTGRRLDYVLDPVSDDLHDTTFTCRVTRTASTANQTITLTVIGEAHFVLCAFQSINRVISRGGGAPPNVYKCSLLHIFCSGITLSKALPSICKILR